jgi:hypothetical protein
VAFLSLFIITDCKPLFDKGKINCYIRHLKSVRLLDLSYPELDGTTSFTNCDGFIGQTKEKIYGAVAAKYKEKNHADEVISCIIDDFRSKNWADYSLLTVVYKADSRLSSDEQPQKESESRVKSFKEALISQQKCGFTDDIVSKLYDKEFQSSPQDSPTPEQAFCQRKFVVDRGLIDLDRNQLIVNPKNLTDKN